MKKIPYGIADYEELVRQNCYIVDKTQYIKRCEDIANFLFIIRPRRFGKSVFINMLTAYYDLAKKDCFENLFDGTWIGSNPTPERNQYQVLRLDFSKAAEGMGTLKENFNSYMAGRLREFLQKYEPLYDGLTIKTVAETDSAPIMLNAIDGCAREKRHKLYLIIDEYDNFTNNILAREGKEAYRELTHGTGFYREYYKIFKGMFTRVFMTGVSPVTLDDLTSGYNIDMNISNLAEFNAMLGFEEAEVREMLTYYKAEGAIKRDVEEMIEEMRPWYDNYCFAEEKFGEETVYNCDLALYYTNSVVRTGMPPKDMVDKNIKTDYGKLRMLVDIDRGRGAESRFDAIENAAARGRLSFELQTSFPAEHIVEDNNFQSLLFYYGMLTVTGRRLGKPLYGIPNLCAMQQYWAFLRSEYGRRAPLDVSAMTEEMYQMAADGLWKPLITRIAEAYKKNSSARDAIRAEANVSGFFKAYLALCDFYILQTEAEMNYGYADILLAPDLMRYPEVAHCYIIELKSAKADATDAEQKTIEADAEAQLRRYAADPRFLRRTGKTRIHLCKVVVKGGDMVTCEEVD